jgi:hypothetical protein
MFLETEKLEPKATAHVVIINRKQKYVGQKKY